MVNLYEETPGSRLFATPRQKMILEDGGNSVPYPIVWESHPLFVSLQEPLPFGRDSSWRDPALEWLVFDLREHGWPLLGIRTDRSDAIPLGCPIRGAFRYLGEDVETPEVIFFIVQCLLAVGATLVPREITLALDAPPSWEVAWRDERFQEA